MAEPTQGNPTPPNNQDGLRPPVSNEASTKAFDKFFAEMESLKKTIEESKKVLETQKKLQADLNKASLDEQKARDSITVGIKKLDAETQKYKNTQGEWLAETEAMQAKYVDDVERLREAHRETEKSFFDVSDALMTNTKLIGDERDARQSALFGMRDLRDAMREFDPEIAAGMSKAYGEAANLVLESNKELDAANATVAKESGEELSKALGEMAEGLRDANSSDVRAEALRQQEAVFEAQQAFAQETKKLADELSTTEIAQQLAQAGGVVGIGDIKKEIDNIGGLTEKAVALYKTKNKEASDSDIKRYKEQFVYQQKSLIQQRLEQKFTKELDEQRNKRILKIVEEKKVSKDAAARIDVGSSEGKEADANLIKRHQDTMKGLEGLNATQLAMLENAKESDMRLAEKEAEAVNDVPAWAQKFTDSIAILNDTMGGMFKKEDGWFKTILLILAVSVGAVLGYIFYKVMFIFNILKGVLGLLTNLPFGIGKAIGGVFGKLGGIGGGIGKIFSGIGTKLGGFGKGLATLFPFLGRFGAAFKFGFRVLGKFFFYAQLAVDAVYGAYKGFQQLGNIKGLIMGAIAQMISGLTFGLLDFQDIFNFFNTTMGDVFDGIAGVFEPIVEFFQKVYTNFVDTFSRIMAVFKGDGSIFSKIFKVIQIAITAMVKNIVSYVIMIVKTAFNLFVVLPYKINKFIVEMLVKLAELTYSAFMSLWEYISSGEILADVVNFGAWLYTELIDLFAGIINSIADGLGELPIVGGYIKEALGGGAGGDGLQLAVEKSAEIVQDAKESADTISSNVATSVPGGTVEFADSSVTPIATPSGKVQFAAPSYAASTVNNATTNNSNARMEAANQGGTAVVNAPTTTNISGGGGGESNVMFPTNNRNTEPTLRALLFQECPAL